MGKRAEKKAKKAKAKNTGYEIAKFFTVTDDWYPNYPNNQARAVLMAKTFPGFPPFVRLLVRGSDDFMLYIEKEVTEEELDATFNEFKKIYDAIPTIPDYADQQWFYNRGFVHY